VYAQSVKPVKNGPVYAVADQLPAFPGEEPAIDTYFAKELAQIRRPQEGVVTLSLVVDKLGQVSKAVITNSFSSKENQDAAANLILDQAIVHAALKMPRWEPGKVANQAVAARVLIPLKIKTTGSELAADERPYEYVEQMPSFPGGDAAMRAYIAAEMKYPADALHLTQVSTVVIQFVVSKTGEIINPSIMKSNAESMGQEALRIIKSMPAWVPGKQNGKAVPVRMTIPVVFKNPTK